MYTLEKCLKQVCLTVAIVFLLPILVKAQGDWKLIKDEDNIQVYARDIIGSNLKELKTVARFEATIDAILTLLTDVSAQVRFQYACISSVRVGKHNKYEQSFYQELYMPWPFSNRDAVFKQSISPKSNSKELHIISKSEDNLVPLKAGFVRIPYMYSSWHIKKINEHQIIGEYTIKVFPGGSVPNWLVNLFMDRGPFESVSNMRKLLQEPLYKNAFVEWLHK